jgi:mono/diheme cytochrome c family protein
MDGGGDAGMMALSACSSTMSQVECGQYLVQHIDACADCHSPRGAMGPDPTKLLAGNPSLVDLTPSATDGVGNIPTPNLTQLKAQGWTVDDIKDAIKNGNRSTARGGGLFPIMPYFVFHNMSEHDLDAIAAYIYQLTPIDNPIPAREPLPGPPGAFTLPIPPVAVADIPNSTLTPSDAHYKEAQLGKYLATQAGICMECHTERKADRVTLDMTKAFAGGEEFDLGPLGKITSLNITPDVSGIKGWTAANVQTLIKTGFDKNNMHICPPMPVGPMGAFGGMDDAQALAIGYYITTIPGVANGLADGGTFPMRVCNMPPMDGGMDSGKP